MEKNERNILRLTATSHYLVHLYEGVLPPLIPLLLLQFQTDYFHLGVVVSIFSYAFGIGALPAGALTDRVAPLRLVALFLFGAGAISILIATASDIWTYGLLMGCIGLLASIYHPAANTMISLVMTEKGRAFGIHGIAGSLGIAAVPVMSAFLGAHLGWQAPHVLYGALGIAAGMFALYVHGPGRGRPVEKQTPPAGPAWGNLLRLVVFFASAACLGLTYRGVVTFLPVYMGEQVHLSFLTASPLTMGGTVATVALLSGAFGQYLCGRLVDRHRPEWVYSIAIGLGMLFTGLMSVTVDGLLVVSAIGYAFFYFASQPVQNFLLTRYLPPHRQGIGFGIHFFLTFGVGSTAAMVSGYLADRFGLPSVFYAMTGCFAASLLLSLVLCGFASRERKPAGARRAKDGR